MYYITICYSKQLQEGLMVFSAELDPALSEDQDFFSLSNSPKLSCGFNLFNLLLMSESCQCVFYEIQ